MFSENIDQNFKAFKTNYKEKRIGNRRKHDRRYNADDVYSGTERRRMNSDRRITIYNRNNQEVTDRRTIE